MINHLKPNPAPIQDDAAEHLVEAYEAAAEPEREAEPAGEMTDEIPLWAYQRTDGEPGNPGADALLTEIEYRHLSF